LNKKRAVILNTAIIFGFFAVFFRLSDLMIINHGLFLEKAKAQHIKSEDIQVRRGRIFDRRGREFAVNLELESLYCNPEAFSMDSDGLTTLSKILGMKQRIIKAKFSPKKKFVWVDRKLSPQKTEEIKELDIEGCGFVPEAKRIYPKGKLATHIIGAVGIDNQALEGIELEYDDYLRASGGKIYFERDAKGRMLSSGVTLEAKGNDLLLTIDEGLQYIVEKELRKAKLKWKAKAASAIMMDPYTGEIFALANYPTYDPNVIGKARKSRIRNRAITDIYEPGSTFKVIVAAAALEEGLFSIDTLIDCSEGKIVVGGKAIHDSHGHDKPLTLREVIQKSSNVGAVKIGLGLGKEKIYEYARRFGFGEETGIDLPGEISGWIRGPNEWSGTSIGAISIGQEVAVTPLQILRAYSAIANGGYLVKPHVVSEIRDTHGQLVYSFEHGELKMAVSAKTAMKSREILKSVVKEGGTAPGASIEGNQVAGKTGTAQIFDPETRKYSMEKFISSFVGFVPADFPKLAMIVVIHEPQEETYGGKVAAPVFKDIAEQALSYMNVPREDGSERNLLLVAK
jgi:cell division protein FtsI (penicillin-binding protein 3)